MSTGQRLLISEMTPAMRIDQVFMISQPQLRTTSRGDYYIAAFLSDRSGRVNGRMWQASKELFEQLPQEGFVQVRGRTENYQNTLQLVIDAIEPVKPRTVDLTEFLPQSERDIDEMFAQLAMVANSIEQPAVKELIQMFLNDPEIMGRLRVAPAAKLLHHAYLGGLLEHTVNLLELAKATLPLYPRLDRDLVLAGLILHDLGKTTELHYDIAFDYTDEGHLMGHLVKGAILVEQKVAAYNDSHETPFPEYYYHGLMHLIVSHHGHREFGSPVMPAMPEAFFIHYLDNIDAKMAMTFSQIDNDNNRSNWTPFIRAIDAPLYKVRSQDDLDKQR